MEKNGTGEGNENVFDIDEIESDIERQQSQHMKPAGEAAEVKENPEPDPTRGETGDAEPIEKIVMIKRLIRAKLETHFGHCDL